MAANVDELATAQLTVDGTSRELVDTESSPGVRAPIDTSRVFDFFGLPLELRDRI
jgi:hypothetical protein